MSGGAFEAEDKAGCEVRGGLGVGGGMPGDRSAGTAVKAGWSRRFRLRVFLRNLECFGAGSGRPRAKPEAAIPRVLDAQSWGVRERTERDRRGTYSRYMLHSQRTEKAFSTLNSVQEHWHSRDKACHDRVQSVQDMDL